jgi:hypothetical protein
MIQPLGGSHGQKGVITSRAEIRVLVVVVACSRSAQFNCDSDLPLLADTAGLLQLQMHGCTVKALRD